jgi:hypothetical protein
MEIWLYFNPCGITQKQWEGVWDECHDVLQRFPVTLASLFYEEKWDTERKIWKSQLIQNEDNETFLCLQNDMASLVFGGRFRLCRNLSYYKASTEPQDILWVKEDYLDDFGRNYRIWDNGTRGAPYSLAVLAVGILLENRFPFNCYMYGFEYADTQIGNMRAWLAGALKTDIAFPVCNDPAHLWQRLRALYSDIAMATQRFCKLVKVPPKECFEFLITQGYHEALQNELIREMSRFSSVSQWGVTDLLHPYLEAIKDVEQVALLVKRVHEKNGKEDFSLEILLEDLLSKGITISPHQSEMAKEWNNTGDGLVTTMDSFSRLFLRMGGMPNRIDYYISSDQLLEIFACMEPANGLKFKEIIETETPKCLERYQKMEDVADTITERALNTEPIEESDKTEIMARWTQRHYLPFEDYILREVEEQVKSFENLSRYVQIVAENLARIMKESEQENDSLRVDSREEALKQISQFADRHGITLREITWETIDNEPDLEMLTMLMLLTGLILEEQNAWNLRKYILETPTLWAQMLEVFLKEGKE